MRKLITVMCILLLLAACSAPQTESTGISPQAQKQLVAHAGGAIYGYRYTNSREAFDNAYAGGYKYIEADLSLTADGVPVLIHDWDAMAERMLFSAGRRTHDEFMSSPTFAGLTLMDAQALFDWMKGHDGCMIITDCKDDNAEIISYLFDAAPELRERFIVQIYSAEEYEQIKKLGAENIILTLYRMDTAAPAEIAGFAAGHPLWALTVSAARLDEEMLECFEQAGITVYAHTVNELAQFEKLSALGLDGIYTDYFVPAHWTVRD